MKTAKAYSFIGEDADKKHIRKDIEQKPLLFLQNTMQNRFGFGVDNITHLGTHKEMGWSYDLRPFLKSYVYKYYDTWQEMYALNKTNVRQLVGSGIQKIIEIK